MSKIPTTNGRIIEAKPAFSANDVLARKIPAMMRRGLQFRRIASIAPAASLAASRATIDVD
jgi:hypothetical protein